MNTPPSRPGTELAPPPPLPLRTNIIWSSAGSLTKTMCSWLMTIAAVRLSSGFDTAGVLALAMSISNLVFPIAEYRLRTVQVTDVHEEHTSQEYLGMRIIASSAALIIGGIYTLLTTNPNAFLVIMVYTLSQVVATYLEGFHATEQRSMRMDYIGISYLLQGVGSLIAFCVGIILFNSLLAATLLLAAAIVTVGIFYDAPRARRFGSIRPVIRWRDASATFARLLPLASVNAALSVVTLIPRQRLSNVMGADALGIYASVAVPAVIIQASATYIYTPVLGRLIELMMTDKPKAVALLTRIAIFFGVVGAASCAVFWVAGEWILGLVFGREIIPHVYLIQPALLLSLITAFVWFTNDILLGLRDYIGCLLGGIVAAGVTMIVTAPLTDLFDLNAPSIVGIIASVIALLVMGFFFVRDYNRLIPMKPLSHK